MKYIKEYNQVYYSLTNNEYYKLKHSARWENFTQDELNTLYKVLKPDYSIDKIIVMDYCYFDGYFDDPEDYQMLQTVFVTLDGSTNGIYSIDIIKLPDEWFTLNISRGDFFYKCDQFEGLLMCLKKHGFDI